MGNGCAGKRVAPHAGFNCAAPFRERLDDIHADAGKGQVFASIVPPPFGSG